MTDKQENYFKWLFTRWYLYIFSILILINSLKGEGVEIISEAPGVLTGMIVASLLIAIAFITFIDWVVRIFKRKKKVEE